MTRGTTSRSTSVLFRRAVSRSAWAARWSRSRMAPLGAERATMRRVGEAQEVGLPEENERRSMCRGKFDRAEHLFDGRGAFRCPPDDASDEALQSALFVRRHDPRPERRFIDGSMREGGVPSRSRTR